MKTGMHKIGYLKKVNFNWYPKGGKSQTQKSTSIFSAPVMCVCVCACMCVHKPDLLYHRGFAFSIDSYGLDQKKIE